MKQMLILLILVFFIHGCNKTNTAAPDHENGNSLPYPDPEFKGKIGTTFEDSQADFPQPLKAPDGAPNVILILLDDVGFGQAGTFGGSVPTPNLDALAAEGLRYNRFHTAGVCSPSRAALLTGRNHHQVASGTITELSTGFPGYNSMIPKTTATTGHILKENGYATGFWGKNHNTPDWETNANGPFEHWPSGWGFEYFYGFQGGETSQWEPQLFRNNVAVEPPKTAEQGYQLTEDLVDDCVKWINVEKSLTPDKPFFAYFATGAAHAPLHAPKEWIEKFKGKFDQGWDQVRIETLNRQKKLGIVPQNTLLTPRPKEIEAWASLSPDAKKVYARHMEAFAGYLAYADYQIGRLLAAVKKIPGAENTMIICVVGDNGASPEGSVTGTLNNMMTQNGLPDDVPTQLAKIDEIGSSLHENHYPVGWAWAGSSPFQWMKRVPSHFGGTRNGLIISWPAKIKDKGGMRSQFHHVIDIAPTILAAAHVKEPEYVDGIKQVPMAGIDMSYTFDDKNAKDKRTLQYFETGGHRAIYKDGWVAASFHGVPWALTGSIGFKNNKWELYDIDKDFSEATDLSAKYPDKLKELEKVFDEEAKKYQVYPLDDRFAERSAVPRPSVVAGRTKFEYSPGAVRIPEGSAPHIYQRSHTITANIDMSKGSSTNGVIVACGGGSGGYTLYVKDGKLHYDYNFFGRTLYSVVSSTNLPSGVVNVKMKYDQLPFKAFKEATGGTVTLFINDKPSGTGKLDVVVPARFSATETMDIGMDLGSCVSTAYKKSAPFKFTGTINKVTFEVSKTQPTKK